MEIFWWPLTQFLSYDIHYHIRISEVARCCGTNLNVIFSHWLSGEKNTLSVWVLQTLNFGTLYLHDWNKKMIQWNYFYGNFLLDCDTKILQSLVTIVTTLLKIWFLSSVTKKYIHNYMYHFDCFTPTQTLHLCQLWHIYIGYITGIEDD